MKKKFRHLYIDKNFKIIEVLTLMDNLRRKLLILAEGDIFLNLVSIGDLQRALIRGADVNDSLETIFISEKIVANIHESQPL